MLYKHHLSYISILRFSSDHPDQESFKTNLHSVHLLVFFFLSLFTVSTFDYTTPKDLICIYSSHINALELYQTVHSLIDNTNLNILRKKQSSNLKKCILFQDIQLNLHHFPHDPNQTL